MPSSPYAPYSKSSRPPPPAPAHAAVRVRNLCPPPQDAEQVPHPAHPEKQSQVEESVSVPLGQPDRERNFVPVSPVPLHAPQPPQDPGEQTGAGVGRFVGALVGAPVGRFVGHAAVPHGVDWEVESRRR